MPKADRLRLKDIRDAYRLIGECRELGADPRAWRLHLLNRLRELTGAQVALGMTIRDLGTTTEAIEDALDAGFLEPSHRDLWGHYQRTGAQRDDLFHLSYYRGFTGALRTRDLQSVVDRAAWHRTFHYNEYIRACGLEDRIASSVAMPIACPARVDVIVLHRSAADGSYPRRSVRLVHLVHEEIAAELGGRLRLPSEAGPTELPLRLEQILLHLLRGESEKQIARRLGLSPYTVNRHVQRLHRHFAVHSRGELMFRCRELLPLLERDNRPPPAAGSSRRAKAEH